MVHDFKDYRFQLGNRKWKSVAIIVVDLNQFKKISYVESIVGPHVDIYKTNGQQSHHLNGNGTQRRI